MVGGHEYITRANRFPEIISSQDGCRARHDRSSQQTMEESAELIGVKLSSPKKNLGVNFFLKVLIHVVY